MYATEVFKAGDLKALRDQINAFFAANPTFVGIDIEHLSVTPGAYEVIVLYSV